MYLGRAVERGPVDDIFHDAKHPYTQALLRSIPDIRAKPRTKLATLSGSIPHPLNRPQGCPFHPRCDQAIKGLCDQHAPPPVALAPDREVSCFLHGGRP
jgi:peptide/nickel transport system ATP-binding protein